MEEDWHEKAIRKVESLEEGTEKWKRWKKCADSLHTKLTLRIDLTYDDGPQVKKVCENCGAVTESWGYKEEIRKVILKNTDGEMVESFSYDDEGDD